MSQNFACLVINLDGSDDRLRAISAALGRAGVAFDRLPAVDGRARPSDAFPDYDGDRAMRPMGRGLMGGEIGCYLSHLAAARAFLDTGAPYGLVLEDDAAPVSDLCRVVARTVDFLDAADPAWRIVNLGAADPAWRIVNLGNKRKFKLSTPCLEIESGSVSYRLERAYYFPLTTGAILWSRPGADEFVTNHDRIFASVDYFFRHWITRAGGGYAFAPQSRPVPQNKSFQSQICSSQRNRNMLKKMFHFHKRWRMWKELIIALRHNLTAPRLPGATHDERNPSFR